MTATAAASPSPASAPPPPGPRPWPIVGNLVPVAREGQIPYFQRLWKQHGDHFVVKLGPKRMHVLIHPEMIEHVLWKRPDVYRKEEMYDEVRRLTGQGLLTFEGAEWRKRRMQMQPAFHRKKIQQLVSTFVRCTDERLADWRQRFPSGGTMDMHAEMMKLTLEVVGEALFGVPLGASADQSGRMFAEALELLGDRGNSAVNIPMGVPTPSNRRLRKALEFLHTETLRIITAARKRHESGEEEAPTLLSMLFDLVDEETGQPLTDLELRNETITLFLAGHETTALLLSWGQALLTENPAAEEAMHAEIADVLDGAAPDARSLRKLDVLSRTIQEMLRLRSPVYTVGRDCVKDDVMTDGTVVRAGEGVLPFTYFTHRHPDFWTDPERFDPDRFLPEAIKERHKWAYFPFSMGERQCIGNQFSLTEAQVVLTRFSQECRLTHTNAPVKADPSITFRPEGPIEVRLDWR